MPQHAVVAQQEWVHVHRMWSQSIVGSLPVDLFESRSLPSAGPVEQWISTLGKGDGTFLHETLYDGHV